MRPLRIFIGFDPREREAYAVTDRSIRTYASMAVDVQPLVLEHLRWKKLYSRPTESRDGRLWDVISQAPMSTEFALTRFLVPVLAGFEGWALFVDCDFLFRADVAELFALADDRFAVQVVKHGHVPVEAQKMDGQQQTAYSRKNWSSLMLWNCAHPMHAGQLERVSRWPGLMLHGLRWLHDEDIGELPVEWNALEAEPKAYHFTRGVPTMPGYENAAFADEWRQVLDASRTTSP